MLMRRQLRRLHRALTTPFNPDAWNTVEHGWILRSIWRNLRPGEAFIRKGDGWKKCGFQGADPATDVRGGGLLAMQCLEYFSDKHGACMRAMLDELDTLIQTPPQGTRFYPVSTTAIVIVVKLCNALKLADGMRGPISSKELEALLESPTRAPVSLMIIPHAKLGGFFGLFSLLLVDFHVRFVRRRATYMMAQQLLTETFAELEKQVG